MVRLDHVKKQYSMKKLTVNALDDIYLHVEEGEFVVVRGPSGSGKTTLLLTIGGMLRPSSGQVIVNGDNIYSLSEKERARFRAHHIGFVFQMFHLLPYLTTVENVMLPAAVHAHSGLVTNADKLLDRLRMSERKAHKPYELSAGERQRVALARALLTHPKLILADEPTGNLDPDNAADVIRHLAEFHKGGGTVIVVTHGQDADKYADRVVLLKKGRIDSE